MQIERQGPILFAGTSHLSLANEISKILNVKLGSVSIQRFPDGEVSVEILESVRGQDVFILQSIALDPDHYLMELLVLVDALKRACAKNIVAIIPYFGYSRQDRKDKPRVPITAKLVANLLETSGVTHVLTMDLHAGQLQGFFDIPLDNLTGRPPLVDALMMSNKTDSNNIVVVCPDIGSTKLAKAYAHDLHAEFALVTKHRISADETEVIALIGDVKGKDVLLADDMCTTGSTLLSAAKACQEKGAKSIRAVVTHAVFADDAISKIENSPIDALYVTNTISLTERLKNSTKIHIVSVAPLLAKAIQCILSQESILPLYE
jgi:ribose-phosphate pyrophosphokinase